MKYNYLGMMKKHGFNVPKTEESFDEQTYTQIIDKREEELNSIIMFAFYNLQFLARKDDNTLVFKSPNQTKYYVYTTCNEIIATIEKTGKSNLSDQHEFIITIDEEGNVIFEQLLISENNTIIKKTFVVDKPGYYETCTAYIEGYDETTFDLFKESIFPDMKGSYINHFINFLNVSEILPDISRKILIQSSNFNKTSICEYDLLSGRSSFPIKNISVSTNALTSHSSLESYVRARDFPTIIAISKGLTSSLQEEISLSLKIPKDIYNFLSTINQSSSSK